MLSSLARYGAHVMRLALQGAMLLTVAVPLSGCGENEIETRPAIDAEQARQNHIETMQRESGQGEAPQY